MYEPIISNTIKTLVSSLENQDNAIDDVASENIKLDKQDTFSEYRYTFSKYRL